ncbi:MAG: restriction endonuclease subunit S [Desulfamplus sp.]|nr:restriction endonuclease subunit S [Desulfamplus sp.]
MKYGLSEKQLDEIIGLISSYPEVEEAILFGSRAIDTFKAASDVDIALKGEKVNATLAAKIQYDFEEDTYLPFFFDFIAYPTIDNQALREHIETKGVVIYRKGWREVKFTHMLVDESISYGIVQPGSHTEINSVPIIRVNNIKNGIIDTNVMLKVASEIENKYQRTRLEGGELLITVVGSIGECAIVPNSLKGWNVARAVSVARIKNNFDKRYIKYCFQLDDLKFQLYGNTNDTVQPTLNLSSLKELIFNIPPLPEQKAIASVLSSLDDKIDLLHRQNKTLEAMAETLFKQWFVVEAREDWEEKSLLDVVQLVGGGTPKTSTPEYWEGDIYWLSGGDIAINHKSFVMSSEKMITANGLNNSSAKLLPKYTTVISARGTVGKYCLLSREMTYSQSNYGVLPKIDNCFFFTYLIINHVVSELQSSAYGSVFDTITTVTFKDNTVYIPIESRIIEFEKQIAVYFCKKLINQKQIRTLEKLRNALLPKLMSGEVRVKY